MIQSPAAPAVVSAGDTAWLLVSTALVMVMVPGIAFFYGGLVRGKSASTARAPTRATPRNWPAA